MSKKIKKRDTIVGLQKGLFIFAAIAILAGVMLAGAQFGKNQIVAADAPNGDTKSVIVHFKNVSQVTGRGDTDRQQDAISSVAGKIADATPYSEGFKLKVRDYDNLPYAVYTVDAAGEESLKNDPNVAEVIDNTLSKPGTYVAIPAIGGSTTTGFSDGATDYTGSGYAVAILDTGVEKTHDMLSGKVVGEACFNTTTSGSGFTSQSRCPGGADSSTATGSAADCDGAVWTGCGHGTAVASFAAGKSQPVSNGQGLNVTLSGSAMNAKIVAINIFSKVTSVASCGSSTPCVLSFASDQVAALDFLIGVATADTLAQPIAAVNMSLGGSANSTADQATCDAEQNVQPINAAAATLKNLKIATVVATGNNGADAGQQNKLDTPGCGSNVIGVGATNRAGNTIASYSNNGPMTDLLAPGGDANDLLVHAATNNSYDSGAGTSYATPLVSGAFAVLRQKHPNASVDSLLSILQSTGTAVNDTRSGYTVDAKPRINLATALVQSPKTKITALIGPSGTISQGEPITVHASVAAATGCSINNGVGTVLLSNGTVTAIVPGAASYILSCTNAYGDTDSQTINFNTNAAPSVPVVLSRNYDKENAKYTVSWEPSTDTDGIQEYRVYLNSQMIATLPSDATTFTAENLYPSVGYTLEVRAVDTLGAVSSALSVTFGDTTAIPGAPNTGALSLMVSSNARAALVAAMGILTVVAIIFAAKRKANR